jgi:anti-sigma-K factor RskA
LAFAGLLFLYKTANRRHYREAREPSTMNETDRMARAGNYVLGLMSEADRERAERDIAYDPFFREAVTSVAERMRLENTRRAPADGGALWTAVSNRIAELPQMRGLVAPEVVGPAAASSKPAGWRPPWRVRAPAVRLDLIAAGMIAVFALGFVAGALSSGVRFGTNDVAGHIVTP